MDKLHAQIDFKCKSAEAITLFPDSWVDNLNTEYLGLGTRLTNDCFEKKVISLGFIEVIGGHCSENIKAAIETIVNKYEFDKSKVKGKMCLFFYLMQTSIKRRIISFDCPISLLNEVRCSDFCLLNTFKSFSKISNN